MHTNFVYGLSVPKSSLLHTCIYIHTIFPNWRYYVELHETLLICIFIYVVIGVDGHADWDFMHGAEVIAFTNVEECERLHLAAYNNISKSIKIKAKAKSININAIKCQLYEISHAFGIWKKMRLLSQEATYTCHYICPFNLLHSL